MKKIDYKKEIKKALESKYPYSRDNGLFNPGIILYCQNPIDNDSGWISKAEISECLRAYLEDDKPDYSEILFPTEGCKEVIRRAKHYIDYVMKREEKEKKIAKKLGFKQDQIMWLGGKEFKLSLNADEIDRRIDGFEERAKKYVKSLNLPVKILKIIPATYFPPEEEEDFKDKRLMDCFVKKTKEELERDIRIFKKGFEKGYFYWDLESEWKMVKYAGINVIFEEI